MGYPQRSFSLLSYCRAFTQRLCNALCMAPVIFTSQKGEGIDAIFILQPPTTRPDLGRRQRWLHLSAQEPWAGGAYFTRSCRSVLSAQRNDTFPRGHRSQVVWGWAGVDGHCRHPRKSAALSLWGRTQDPKSDLAKAEWQEWDVEGVLEVMELNLLMFWGIQSRFGEDGLSLRPPG